LRTESRRAFGIGATSAASLATAALAGGVYVALRPPLFNFDGYVYRLYAFGPFTPDNLNPHHLLWYPLQRALLGLSQWLGHPTAAPFQLFGILVSCVALVALQRLLRRVSGSIRFATVATAFVAFSPKFWFFTLQNQPYPLVYLFLVLYLGCWYRADGSVPAPARLVAAGFCLSLAIFFQQGMALLVPAGVAALAAGGPEPMPVRLRRAALWGAGTTAFVLAVYIAVGWPVPWHDPAGFLAWTTTYLQKQHGLQIRLPDNVVKSFIGMLRSLIPMNGIEEFFASCCSYRATLAVFGTAGLAAGGLVAVWLRRAAPDRGLRGFARRNSFFMVSALTMLAWSGFVFAWEPLGYYWALNHVAVAACLAALVRERRPAVTRFARASATALILVVTGANLLYRHHRDGLDSINDPEPLLDAIHRDLGQNDLFVVLGRDWYDGMDFDLLLECLDTADESPARAILDDYVLDPEGPASWRQDLGEDVRAALERGGKVFVASHVFSAASYADLAQSGDPFCEYARDQYAAIDGPALRRDVEQIFSTYRLVPSSFRLGREGFLEVRAP
jgi:hypothetical protein